MLEPAVDAAIALSDKRVPTTEMDPAYAAALPLAVHRGFVDVSALRDRIAALPETAWTDEYQAQHNVALRRPGHDRWGVSKIIFAFSDDFNSRLFRLPWWDTWADVLTPIFEAVGVPPHRVVRCLLARMPPGVEIPVHHDTGEWVSESHRMHNPVVTDDAVRFCVGPNEETLQQVAFRVGSCVELNNRSKHSVTNGWDQHRIHLIWDYLEEDPPLSKMLALPVGAQLSQTRRTVNLLSEGADRQPLPDFVIIGAQKAGTTSLFDYMCQHGMICRSRRKETHFFDWKWTPELEAASEEEQRAAYLKCFFAAELSENPSVLTGEATPSYMLGGATVRARLARVAPQAKIIAIVRDPVARAYSQYQMAVDPVGSEAQLRNRGHVHVAGKSFAEVIATEMRQLQEAGIDATSAPADLEERVLAHMPTDHGGHSFLVRGLYSLLLEPWAAAYGPGDRLLVLRAEDMAPPHGPQTTLDRVSAFLGIPPATLGQEAASLEGRKNTREYPPMAPEDEATLRAFFAPFTARFEAFFPQVSSQI